MPIGNTMLSKMWGDLGSPRFDNPFTFTFFQKKLHVFNLSYVALTLSCQLEPVYNCTYLWCKFFNVISVEYYWISHNLLNHIQTYFLFTKNREQNNCFPDNLPLTNNPPDNCPPPGKVAPESPPPVPFPPSQLLPPFNCPLPLDRSVKWIIKLFFIRFYLCLQHLFQAL